METGVDDSFGDMKDHDAANGRGIEGLLASPASSQNTIDYFDEHVDRPDSDDDLSDWDA